MLYKDAIAFTNKIKERLRIKGKKCKSVVVGSLRRKEPEATDIDLLIITGNTLETLTVGKLPTEGGKKRRHIKLTDPVTGERISIDFFQTTQENLPYALFHYTGSKQYNIRTRAKAKRQGYKLSQYGLFKGDKKIKVKTEYDIMKFLGLTLRKPKDRDTTKK